MFKHLGQSLDNLNVQEQKIKYVIQQPFIIKRRLI